MTSFLHKISLIFCLKVDNYKKISGVEKNKILIFRSLKSKALKLNRHEFTSLFIFSTQFKSLFKKKLKFLSIFEIFLSSDSGKNRTSVLRHIPIKNH